MKVMDSANAWDGLERRARRLQGDVAWHAFAEQMDDLAEQTQTKDRQQDCDCEAGHRIGGRRSAGENNERRGYHCRGAQRVASEMKDQDSGRPCPSFAPMHDESRGAVQEQADGRDGKDQTGIDRRRGQQSAHALDEDDRRCRDEQDRVCESPHRLQPMEAVGVVFIGFAGCHVGRSEPNHESHDVDQDVGGVAQECQASSEEPTADLDCENRKRQTQGDHQPPRVAGSYAPVALD